MDDPNTIADDLNTLLASYAEPCIGDCEHSQCPLLRELHALRIKVTLEKARLTVKPIVDSERQGEQIGDLMNTRLDIATPRATGETTVEAALAELREMFPRHYCSVSHGGRLVLGMSWKLKKVETVAQIRITSAIVEDPMLPVEADADSLNEAMNQVREWAARNRVK